MARKLILTRDETAERVIEALNAFNESALTVVAPRGSALADREQLSQIGDLAAERGIAVAIESVDEELLSLAHAAHLETVHPFFRADKRHLALDGVQATKHTTRHPAVAARHAEHAPRPHRAELQPVIVHDDDAEENPLPPHDHPVPTPVAARPSYEAQPVTVEDRPRKERRMRLSRPRAIAAALIAIALVVGIGEGFMRSGSVAVTLAETPWEYSGTVVAATSVTTTTVETGSIPGQLFETSPPLNVAQPFPATGEPGASSVPAGARPKVTVYNESLEAETFVVRTRFQGKAGVFRAATAVAIPAAKKDGDKLTPGTASVEVTPDSEAVLTGSSDGERLTVPGLAGSPKANLFYGVLSKPAAPEAKPAQSTTPPSERVVTDADAEGALAKINDILIGTFKTKLLSSKPEALALIEGAIQIEQRQLTVNKEVDASGNFNVVGQATLRGLAFKEDDLKALLLKRATSEKGINYPATFRSYEVGYSDVQPDLANGRLTFKVTVRGSVIGQATEESIRAEVAGKSRGEAAEWLRSQEQFKEGSVSVRPFWRFTLPADPAKVRLEIK